MKIKILEGVFPITFHNDWFWWNVVNKLINDTIFSAFVEWILTARHNTKIRQWIVRSIVIDVVNLDFFVGEIEIQELISE